ncbi:hypothetical protein V500_07459 [Pseudogymnoascus sp. VKM F-4518 (FW-2643)]|nr:hypothetical protein V500_07459 [Pseudogymnoascus sp. VKM F-4518 (FW-2643)]
MKLSSHLLAASVAAVATARAPVPKICGNGFLHPNSTAELTAMVNCTQSTAYQCLDQYNLRKDDKMAGALFRLYLDASPWRNGRRLMSPDLA